MTPEQEAKIIALCERIGMPWEQAHERAYTDHPWNGRALNLLHRVHNNASPTSDLVHDVAHWLVAEPERRADPSFGLDQMAVFMEPEPGCPDDVAEEQRASLLGLLLERAMGMDWKYTWGFHSWEIEGWSGVRDMVRKLQHLGHLRGLMPTCLLGATSSTPVR